MKKLFLIATCFFALNSYAQNIGIGTTTPAEKLDVNGGIRLGNTSGTNAGTLRWNSNHLQVYSGTGWINLDSNASAYGWLRNGNLGTSSSTDFIGTKDANDFVIRTNNIEKMRVSSAGKVGIGTSTTTFPLEVSVPSTGGSQFNLKLTNLTLGIGNSVGILFAPDDAAIAKMGILVERRAPWGFSTMHFLSRTTSDYASADISNSVMSITQNGNLGIGTTTPQSRLSVGSTSQFQVDNVGNVVKINNITTSFPATQGSNGQVLANDGSGNLSWSNISTSTWALAGNGGTSATTNFIGTTDSIALSFKVNNSRAGFIDPGTKSTFIGIRAGKVNSTGIQNTANGYEALFSVTGGSQNTANGTFALHDNTTGNSNSASGWYSLNKNTTGSYNTATGEQAMYWNNGNLNAAYGFATLQNNYSGSQNTVLGAYSGYNSDGSGNVYLGYQAGYGATGSNKLYVANSSTNPPLIYGDFSTGNLGLGTTSPAEKFVVQGTSVDGRLATFYNTGNDNSYITLGRVLTNAGGFINYKSSTNYLALGIHGNTEQFVLTGGGNIGMGTTIPNTKLQVYGNSGNLLKLQTSNIMNTAGQSIGISFATSADTETGRIEAITESNGNIGMRFYTYSGGANERLRISSTGNVGIGTTNPGAKLELFGGLIVKGGLNTDKNITITGGDNSATAIGGNVSIGGGTGYNALGGTLNLFAGMTSSWASAGTSSDVTIKGGEMEGFGNSQIIVGGGKVVSGGSYSADGGVLTFQGGNANGGNRNGGNILLIPGAGNGTGVSGNVGIGTITPLSRFSIGATSQFQVDSNGNIKKINNIATSFPSTQGTYGQVLANDGSGNMSWQSATSLAWGLTGNAGTTAATNFIGTTDANDFVIKTNNSEKMRISSAGKVGIGTANTTFPLEVSVPSTGGSQFNLKLTNLTLGIGNGVGILFAPDDAAIAKMGIFVERKAAWGFGTMHFLSRTTSDYTSADISNSVMSLTQNGNLGIGTTNPSAKLEVNGQVKITGGTPGVGKVLTSDATGLATWQATETKAYGMAYRTTAFDIPSITTWTDLPLNGGNSNLINVVHSTITNPERVTVSVGGTYMINYTIRYRRQSIPHHGVARLIKNGANEVVGSYSITSPVSGDANEDAPLTGQVITTLSANDYINLQVATNYNVTNEVDVYSGLDLPVPSTRIFVSLTIVKIGD